MYWFKCTRSGFAADGILTFQKYFPDFREFYGLLCGHSRMKLADALCTADPDARLIVCTELCTLHFQQKATTDNITSSLLFGDGSAAVLVTGSSDKTRGFPAGILWRSMPKETGYVLGTSSAGFAMTLSNYAKSDRRRF